MFGGCEMSDEKHSQIAQRARQIWQREGCPQGRADAHWKQAEEELAREAGQTGSPGQSAPYVPADEAMIEPATDSPVIAGVSVPSEPPLPAAEAEQRKSASEATSEGSAPYVPADEPMIEPDAASPVIAGASVPSKPPTPAAEAEQRKRGATAKSAGAAKSVSTTRAASKTVKLDKNSDDKKKKKKE